MAGSRRSAFIAFLARAGAPVGAVCLIVGAAIRYVAPGAGFGRGAIRLPLAIGVLLLAASVAANAGRVQTTLGSRRFRARLGMTAEIALAFILLLLLNAIAGLTPRIEGWAIDCTADRLFTLSNKTQNVLAGLAERPSLTVVMGTGTVAIRDRGKVNVAKRVKDMAALYRATGKVDVAVVDVYREKLRVEKLAQAVGAAVEPNSLVIECRGRHVAVPFFDLVDISEGTTPAFLGEERITAAILKVAEPRPTRVAFTTGHGEIPFDPAEGESLSDFGAALRRDNCVLESVNLLAHSAPLDHDLVIVAGPAAPFLAQEAEVLGAYLRRGGKVLILVRPKPLRGDLGRLEAMLGEFNVRVAQEMAVIEVYKAVGDLRIVVERFGDHPVTQGLRNINCLIENACPVSALVQDARDAGRAREPRLKSPFQVVPLLYSSERSWGETDLRAERVAFDEGKDARGPLTLAVAAEPRRVDGGPEPQSDMRLIVVGSVKAACNEAFGAYVGNRAFLMNCVSWLTAREAQLGIPPERAEMRRLRDDPAAWRKVFLLTVLAMPALSALAGVALSWWRQRG